jgi:signal transduction histidine kinase
LLFAGRWSRCPNQWSELRDGGPGALERCFSILFTNAAKYTSLGGRIEVSLARDDEGAVVHEAS